MVFTVIAQQAAGGAVGWVDVAALFIAGVSLLTSAAVAVVTWVRAGEIIRVSGDVRPVIFQPGARRPLRAGTVFGVVTISCKNFGRTDVEIHALRFVATRSGATITTQLGEQSDPCPITVPARGRATWSVPARGWGVMTKQQGNPVVVRPVVEYGPGKKARGRKLRVAVRDDDLPGAGQHFQSSLGWKVARLPTLPNLLQRRWRDQQERRRSSDPAAPPAVERQVTCVGCAAILDQGLANELPDAVTPCPNCGAIERRVNQVIHVPTAEIKLEEH